MGAKINADHKKRNAFGSRKDQLLLTAPPFLIGLGLVYLFGFHFNAVHVAGTRQVMMASALFVSTLWWLDMNRRRIKATFHIEVSRVYFSIVAVAAIAPLPSVLVGLNGLAVFGACVGYVAAFTYARMNWREGT